MADKENAELRAKNLELRRHLEKTSKELSVAKQQLQSTRKLLHEAELARATTEEYARKLEGQLQKSGKGVALLKAARLQSDMGFLEKENAILFGDLQQKALDVKALQDELQKQRDLVEQAARSVGLPGAPVLEELYDLREQAEAKALQVVTLSDSVLEKEEIFRRQDMELQDFHVYRGQYKKLESQISELEDRMATADQDKAVLLDYIQDMQDGITKEAAAKSAAAASEEDAWARVQDVEKRCAELETLLKEQQTVLHAAQQQTSNLERLVAAGKAKEAALQQERTEVQVALKAQQKQQAVLEQEFQRLSQVLQASLDMDASKAADAGDVGGRIDSLAHRVMSAVSPGKQKAPRSPPTPAAAPLQTVAQVAKLSRQLEVLLAQHRQLKDAVDAHQRVGAHNAVLREQVEELSAKLEAALSTADEVGAQLATSNSHWRRLLRALKVADPNTPAVLVQGKEHEFAALVEDYLAKSASRLEATRERVAGLESENGSLQRQVDQLQDSLRVTRGALTAMPPAEEYNSLLQRAETAEAQAQELQSRLSSLLVENQAALRGARGTVNELEDRLDVVTGQLMDVQRARDDAQLRLRAMQQAMVEQEEELLAARTLRGTSGVRTSSSPTSPSARTAMRTLASQLATDARDTGAAHTTHSVGPEASSTFTFHRTAVGGRAQPVPIIPPQRTHTATPAQVAAHRGAGARSDSSDEDDNYDINDTNADQGGRAGSRGISSQARPAVGGRAPPLPGSIARVAWQQAATMSRSPGSPTWSPPGSPGRTFTTMKQMVQVAAKKPDAVQAKLAALSAAYKQMKR